VVRQRHYVNPKAPGITVFTTTTVLDFVHAFKRPEMKDLLLESVYRECRLARAKLHAFVIMSHHIHLLLTLHPEMSASSFMQDFKSNSSKDISPYLSEEERRLIDVQKGLNNRVFWKLGYRGFPAQHPRIFDQKRSYIHRNPVDAKLVENRMDYRWSSAKLIADGLWNPTDGLPLRSSDWQ
jgi:putative transposase